MFQWLNSLGGPLILISERLLPFWGGADSSDYERLFEVSDYAELVGVGDGKALVLNDEPLQTAWFDVSEDSGMFVRWRYAANEDAVANSLVVVPDAIWQPTKLQFDHTAGGKLFLIDSALPGTAAEESICIVPPPGTYSIDTAEYQPDEETSLLLHRLRLVKA